MRLIRRIAIAVLRSELAAREEAARRLADSGRTTSTGRFAGLPSEGRKRTRIFWDGYAHRHSHRLPVSTATVASTSVPGVGTDSPESGRDAAPEVIAP